MSIEYIKFCVEIEELHLAEPMEIKYNHELIEKIIIFNSIKTFPDTIITFYFTNIEDIEIAKNIAENELIHILNKAAFVADSYIGEPLAIKYKLTDKADEERIHNTHEYHMDVYVGIPDAVKESIEEELPYPIGLYEQYRGAMKSKDIVARYMFLYNILLQLYDDRQKKLDKFIEREFGQDICDYTQSPHGNYNESKFTRLRNEIAHNRDYTDFDNTRMEMKDNIKMLMKIVKKAIKLY